MTGVGEDGRGEKMFGAEQGFAQSNFLLRLAYFLFGEFRYPIRLRAAALRGSLPKNIRPKFIWDAGCGEGQTSFWLAKRFPSAQLIGTDIKKENIERCQQISHHLKSKNTAFLQMDLLSDRNQRVDLIVCFEVLEHVENYGDALRIFAHSLNPTGLIVIHTPANNSFQSSRWGLRKFIYRESNKNKNLEKGQYHVRSGFNADSLAREIEDLRFDVVMQRYTFGPIAMFAHTIYEWTRTRSKILQFFTLWPLLIFGYLDMMLNFPTGGGILIVAQKK